MRGLQNSLEVLLFSRYLKDVVFSVCPYDIDELMNHMDIFKCYYVLMYFYPVLNCLANCMVFENY